MTSWKLAAGGLADSEINKLVSYITKARPSLKPEKFNVASFKADAKHGEELYKVRCALCHGKKGEGELGVNLRNPVVHRQRTLSSLQSQSGMEEKDPYACLWQKGVGLTEQDITDIVSYVKTLSKKK